MPTFIGSWEFLLVLLVVLVVFGAKRLPDSARALGRSMRILKAETKGLRDDGDSTTSRESSSTTVTATQVPPAPVRPTPDPDAEQVQHRQP